VRRRATDFDYRCKTNHLAAIASRASIPVNHCRSRQIDRVTSQLRHSRRAAEGARLQACVTTAASRSDSQFPGALALEHVGGVPKRRRQAVRRELGILRENLFLRCPARGQFEQEFDAETRAANTRLAAENLQIGDDQVFSQWSCLSAMSGRAVATHFSAPWPLGL